ncbi:MAG: GtrA family protein [Treponema sp.]|nr:GtrA family protein [Treponema sp.]MBR1405264.1 GtrA family protein [Treponema sp.]
MKAFNDSEFLLKIIKFTFWGILTTALNVALYYIFRYIKIPVSVSTILAWFLCVLFAFVTNKRYVFKATDYTKQQIVREVILFYGSRLFSGLMDVALMVLMVNILKWNEILSKIIDELLVSGFNFVFSFLVIFRQKKSSEEISENGK